MRSSLPHQLPTWGRAFGLLGIIVNSVSVSLAQPSTPEIYTCVDASGRKLTSDRPILTCRDREQKILNPSGTVKAKIGPTLTAKESAQMENLAKIELTERARLDEEKKRDRALLLRYPNPSAHQKERAEALAQVNVVKQAALIQTKDLLEQRTKLADEMAFYQKDPSKAPPKLQHQFNEVNQALATQGRFLADKDGETVRINAKFDAELVRLMPLWRLSAAASN
jgi:hypothetical protein